MHLVGFVGWLHFQKFHTKLSYICVSELQNADKSNFPVRCLKDGVRLQSHLEGLFFHFYSLLLSLSFSVFHFSLQTLKINFAQCTFVLSMVIPCLSFVMLSELGSFCCLRNA